MECKYRYKCMQVKISHANISPEQGLRLFSCDLGG